MSHYGRKTVQIDGYPCRVAKWVGELGNDREYREAVKPRTAFKAQYYASAHRMIIDGVPVRVAAYVKSWAPWMKRALGKGTPSQREKEEAAEQYKILFGVKP